jgi:hypothetical protein
MQKDCSKSSQQSITQYLQPVGASHKAGAALYVVDADGTIVVHSDDETLPAALTFPISSPPSHQDPAIHSTRADVTDGELQLAASAPLTRRRRIIDDDDDEEVGSSPNLPAQPPTATRENDGIPENIQGTSAGATAAAIPPPNQTAHCALTSSTDALSVIVAPLTRRRRIIDDDDEEVGSSPNLPAQPPTATRENDGIPENIQGTSAGATAAGIPHPPIRLHTARSRVALMHCQPLNRAGLTTESPLIHNGVPRARSVQNDLHQ